MDTLTTAPAPAKNLTLDTPTGPAQLTLTPAPDFLDGRVWHVHLGDIRLGSLRRYTHTPHTKIKGTRLRKDLAPRVVWAADPAGTPATGPMRTHLHLATRREALSRLVEHHQKATADPYVTTLQHGDPEPERAPRDRCCPWLTADGGEVYWNLMEDRWIHLVPTSGQPLLMGLERWTDLPSRVFPITRTHRPH